MACNDVRYQGDARIAQCIYAKTTTKLSWESGLHQVDLQGDLSGFFEAGRAQPLSLHHWKSWYHHDMSNLSLVSSVCGDACLLRRWRFANGWFLNNGYSVVRYSEDVPADDTTMEKTWDNTGWASTASFFHTLGPMRRKDRKKLSLVMAGAVRQEGRVRQFYINWSGVPRVLEVVWRRG